MFRMPVFPFFQNSEGSAPLPASGAKNSEDPF